MTPQQITLVQESWKQVQPISEAAAQLFYERLFSLEPSVQKLFRGDMKEQGRKLMSMIGVAVMSLSNLDRLIPTVQALGVRHASYGVQPRHYTLVGASLLWTLKQGLGDSFTADVEDAWRTAYGVLSSTMQRAADKQAA